ncbi:MAG: hypothetical protein IPJ65_05385 [Archangiaceae bacterium]|nr:hypothetical protein [Archangiaceae bacterium]
MNTKVTVTRLGVVLLLALACGVPEQVGYDTDEDLDLESAAAALTGTQGDVVSSGSGQFQLTYSNLDTPEMQAAIADAVARGALGPQRSVGQVLASANHKMAYKTSSACAKPRTVLSRLDDGPHHVGAWCFDAADEDSGRSLDSSDWVPQAVASSNEAAAGGYTGASAVLVSWYQPRLNHTAGAHDEPQNDRLTFVRPPKANATTAYRHVIFAEPYLAGGKLNLRPVKAHAGGLAWYGNVIYLAHTGVGVRAFDARHIYQVSTAKKVVGLDPSAAADPKLYGAGEAYVILESAVFRKTDGSCDKTAAKLNTGLCFSGVTVNRSASPPSLISYEYRTHADMIGSKVGSRIVHWPLDKATGLLKRGADGKVHSGRLFLTPTYQVQGVAVQGKTFYFSTSQGSSGAFYREIDGDGAAPRKSSWVSGAETVSFTTSSAGDRLWSVSEVPGRRMLFWVYGKEMK